MAETTWPKNAVRMIQATPAAVLAENGPFWCILFFSDKIFGAFLVAVFASHLGSSEKRARGSVIKPKGLLFVCLFVNR